MIPYENQNEILLTAASQKVKSVNGKTGVVVLNASDIYATNSQSIQANLERIDESVEGVIDDLADKPSTDTVQTMIDTAIGDAIEEAY